VKSYSSVTEKTAWIQRKATTEKPDSLNEKEEEPANYKNKLAAMARDVNTNWRWTGEDTNKTQELKYFEAIDGVEAGYAIPEIWAKDVFRCCPYPASAFWDAPFIKWHEDIHGN
jgi:hypothetical protein